MDLKGTKIVEIPYFINQLEDQNKSILVIGECKGGTEGVSESILAKGFNNVTTTDILDTEPDSWLRKNTNWKHIKNDFIKFDESLKFDYVISISVFEHFGFWFAGDRMFDGNFDDDIIKWNHDIIGIKKASKLLKDKESKLIITLPAGPYLNIDPKTRFPFLRYYDYQRQNLIKEIMDEEGFKVINEKFYLSSDFINWDEVGDEINHPKYYAYYNTSTPNVIWGLTIQQK
jgi:hypothetical protein